MDIQEELKQEAISLGLCDKWQNEWGTPNLEQLSDKYHRGLDFCIKHNFPTLDYMDKNFKGRMQPYGIFINEEFNCENLKNVVLNGSSRGFINYDDITVGRIHIRHNSFLNLGVGTQSFVYISIYDNATLNIYSKTPTSKICISIFGGKVIGKTDGVKIHYKNK